MLPQFEVNSYWLRELLNSEYVRGQIIFLQCFYLDPVQDTKAGLCLGLNTTITNNIINSFVFFKSLLFCSWGKMMQRFSSVKTVLVDLSTAIFSFSYLEAEVALLPSASPGGDAEHRETIKNKLIQFCSIVTSCHQTKTKVKGRIK